MTTVTISLPDNLAQQLDQAVARRGFATRSELVRSLLRQHLTEPSFESFTPQPLKTVKSELLKTNKYNQEFIESVTRGLKKSSPYAR